MNQYESSRMIAKTAVPDRSAPRPALSFVDAIALIIGVVIGAGVYELPALVAASTADVQTLMLLWLFGGAVSVIGALCYAELGTAYPNVGGTYHYLKRAFGPQVAFLFAWARMTVIQTGSIALLGFIFGDYASRLFRLGAYSPSIYAALGIALLTLLNILGLQQGKWTQNVLTVAKIAGVLLIIGVGFFVPAAPVEGGSTTATTNVGMAMILILLSYGGWNEAAYISAEIHNGRRNLVRSLLWSIGIITAIYLLINGAYLRGLGLGAVAKSEALAADLLGRAMGNTGSIIISILVVITTLGSINATIFTGARTNYALGQDFSGFRFLGEWQGRQNAPVKSYLLQGAIAIALVGLGTFTREGIQAMVDYTAPVFWFFFLLSGISLFVLRQREPDVPRPFLVPFYPITPILFCLACVYLLYAAITYKTVGSIFGIGVVGLGVIVLYWNRLRQ